MFSERIEKLRQEYTGQQVVIDNGRPELARFAQTPGQVKTINCNGRALVQFEGADQTWHDIALDYLKVIDDPAPDDDTTPSSAEQPAEAKSEPAAADKENLSRLELARMEKEATESQP